MYLFIVHAKNDDILRQDSVEINVDPSPHPQFNNGVGGGVVS